LGIRYTPSGNPGSELSEIRNNFGRFFENISGHTLNYVTILKLFGISRQKKEESISSSVQGCQIFLCPKYQNGGKYTKLPQNIQNGHKIFPMAVN
jgi:hypothetical protein